MKRSSDLQSRTTLTEKVQQYETTMADEMEEVKEAKADVETVRETQASVHPEGTSEVAEAVHEALDDAEGVSVDEFDREGEQMEQIYEDTETHEQEIQERKDSNSSVLGQISEVSVRIHRDVTSSKLIPPKETAVREIEALDDLARKSRDDRETSDREYQEYRRQVNAKGG